MGKVLVVLGFMLLGSLWWGVKLGLLFAIGEVVLEKLILERPLVEGGDEVNGFWDFVGYIKFYFFCGTVIALVCNFFTLLIAGLKSK